MKNSLFILLILIFSSRSYWSQQLPEIPMKDGYICYETKGKLNNKKNCIPKSGVFEQLSYGRTKQEFETLIQNSSNSVLKLKKDEFYISVWGNPHHIRRDEFDCSDTINNFFAIQYSYGLKNLNYFDFSIIGRILGTGKKKIGDITISCEFKMIFDSFNEYKLLGRMFSLKVGFYDGSVLVQDLTDYYLELKKKPKLKKKEVELFNDLNLLMNNINEVLMKKMNDEIRYLEME
jgi:hypothetical protein